MIDPGYAIRFELAQPRQLDLEFLDVAGRYSRCRESKGDAFERGANLEQFDDLVRGPAGDQRPAVGAKRDISFSGKLPDGFTDRHPADAERLRNLLWTQPDTASQRPGHDLVLDVNVSLLFGSREIVHESDPVVSKYAIT